MTAAAPAEGYPAGVVIDRRGHASVPRSLHAVAMLSAAVLVTLVAGCGAPAPSPSAAATAGPTATTPASLPPTSSAPAPTPADTGTAATACQSLDLKASHGLVEGAAGSILTEVILVAAVACSVDAFPPLRLRDASDAALLSSSSGDPGTIDLVAGVAYASQVRLANWCAPEPEFPLSLAVLVAGTELEVTGDSFPASGDLPPCSGEGGPTLEGTGWVATP